MKIVIVILSALLCLKAQAQTSSEKSDEALVAAAEQLIAEGKADAGDTSMEQQASSVKKMEANVTDKAVTEKVADKISEKESDIPVVLSAKKAGTEQGGSIWRMVASLVVVAVTAVIGMFAAKRYGRSKDKGGQKARIEMMHQFHLGPKKSIALIRVAGEAMLVGVTDHNINMIKSVALVDDELEQVANKDFNSFLDDEFSIEDVRGAITRA